MQSVFLVYFEGPFWVGLIASLEDGRATLGRHVFGAEPSHPELLNFLLHRLTDVPRYPVDPDDLPRPFRDSIPVNPKRARREASKVRAERIGGESRAALAAAMEAAAGERKKGDRKARDEDRREQYRIRSERRKERKRGH